MAVAAGRMLHDTWAQPHRGQESEDDGRCGRGRWPLLPGDVRGMGAERQSDLPLAHGRHAPPPHREQGDGRHPCGLRQPYRTDGGGIFAPAQARCHRAMLLLIRLEPLGIRPPLWPHRGRQDRPPGRLLGGPQGLWGPPKARAALALRALRLRRTASPRPLWRDMDRVDLRGQARRTPRPWRAPTPARGRPASAAGAAAAAPGRPGAVTRAAACAWAAAYAPAAWWATWLEGTPSKRLSAPARRPSASSTGMRRTPRGPCQRRGGSCRVRPSFASQKGQPLGCWPQASPSWCPAHVRGTNVLSPTRGSRHPPSVRFPSA
jgi:hypothetical protein